VYHQNNAQLKDEVLDMQRLLDAKQVHDVIPSPVLSPKHAEAVVTQPFKATQVMMDRLIDSQNEVPSELQSSDAIIVTSNAVAPILIRTEEHTVETPSNLTVEEFQPVVEPSPTNDNVAATPAPESVTTKDSILYDVSGIYGEAKQMHVEIEELKDNTSPRGGSDDESNDESMSSGDSTIEVRANSNSTLVASSSTGAAASGSPSDPSVKTGTKVTPKTLSSTLIKSSSKKGPSKLCGIFLLILWLLVCSIALVVLKPDLASSVTVAQVPKEMLSTVYSTVYNYVSSYL